MGKSIAVRISDIPVSQLPDHRPMQPPKYDEFFSDIEIADIVKKFEFVSRYPLKSGLEEAALFFRASIDNWDSASPQKEKRLIDAGLEATQLLRSIIERFGHPELIRIGSAHGNWNRQALDESLFELKQVLKLASNLIEPKDGGRPTKQTQEHLVRHLAEIFESGTGKKAGYTQIPGENSFTGPFIDFVEQISSKLGKNIAHSFVANIVKDRNKENPN